MVNVASAVHEKAKFDLFDIHAPRRYSGFRAYSRSKLCNLLFTYELARRLEGTGVTANALHPGLVASNILTNNGILGRFLNMLLGVRGISVEAGALTSVYAASSPELEGVSGKYLDKKQIVPSSARSFDEAQAAELWELSASLTGISSETPVPSTSSA